MWQRQLSRNQNLRTGGKTLNLVEHSLSVVLSIGVNCTQRPKKHFSHGNRLVQYSVSFVEASRAETQNRNRAAVNDRVSEVKQPTAKIAPHGLHINIRQFHGLGFEVIK